MKFGDYINQPPKVGQKVHLKPLSGSKFFSPSSIHETMREYGFEQAMRRNDAVWRVKYEIPARSWRILRDRLVVEADAKVEKVE